MPAIDFPAAPAVNQEYSFEGRTWLWNGTGWEVKSYPAALQLGSATAPSLYFTGDTNTGLYSPGADQVALTTAGAQKLTVDSLDGNAIIENSFPTIRPSLDLPFALTKTLDPRITFTRASSATYVDSAGLLQTASTDVPRFDHNPTTGESLGLLVEESRANLLTYSELFNAGPWISGNLSIASTTATAAPTGTNTAIRITENTAASVFHFLSAVLTKAASAIQYTFSIYGKAGERELAFSMANGTTGAVARFNFATGVIVQTATAYGGGFTAQSATMTSVRNGWYRCTLTFTTDATTGLTAQVSLYNTTLSTNVYTGDGTSGIYLWGAQLEAGAFPTSYIPTTTATVTRSADACSISGSNFSSWYRQDEGTVFADAAEYPFASSLVRNFYSLGSSTNPNTDYARQWIWNGNTTLLLNSAYTSSSGPVAAEFNVSLAAGFKRTAFAIKTNDFARSFNGQAAATDTAGNMPVGIDRLGIGSDNSSGFLSGHIRRLTYWPQRLSNTTLQALTA